MTTLRDIQRFYCKVDFDGGVQPAMESACWKWTAKVSGDCQGQYGKFWDGTYLPSGHTREVQAHRYAYELIVGPIPDGLQLDHICHNRQCVNPNHLEPVTQFVNAQRCKGAYATNQSSGIRGVTWHKKCRKWQVSVQHAGVKHHGGLFTDLQEAELAAKQLRQDVFGIDENRMDYRIKEISR